MKPLAGYTAFFLLSDVAFVRASQDSRSAIEVAPFPCVLKVLRRLHEEGVKLGLLVEPPAAPEAVARHTVLARYFDDALIVSGSGDLAEHVPAAASRAGTDSDAVPLFVARDAGERMRARAAGFVTAPHPELALPVLHGETLRYLRVRVPHSAAGDWRVPLCELPLVPLHLAAESEAGGLQTIYAVSTDAAASALDDLGFHVDRLGTTEQACATDLYLLRDHLTARSRIAAPHGNSSMLAHLAGGDSILASTEDGLIVALAGGGLPDEAHARGTTMHGERLAPSPAILLGAARVCGPESAHAPCRLTDDEITTLQMHVAPGSIARDVDRYSGVKPLTAGDPLRVHSRHVKHEHNPKVVSALLAELRDVPGVTAATVPVRFGVDNVEARVKARDPNGLLTGIVVIGAHLDSTAEEDLPWHPRTSRAPGADDDASGMAGLMAAIRAIRALRALVPERPHREIRFVFFNEEEQGRIGSIRYASDVYALGTCVRAMFQMDMIGYDGAPPPLFQLHAGYRPDPAVEWESLRLAQVVANMAAQVSSSLVPDLYPATGSTVSAKGRSDHTSFHKQGYAACLATHDFFSETRATPRIVQNNPQYHRKGDLRVDENYAADIARAVAAAAWCVAVTP